jgi:uncharacterized protein (TIGR02145 family)
MKFGLKAILFFTLSGSILVNVSCKKEEPTPDPTNSAPSAVEFNVAPTNGSTGVGSPISISWFAATDPDGDIISYDVYLGTNASNITLVSSNQTGLTYTSSQLDLGANYFLRVNAKAGIHSTPSETRNFFASLTGSFTDSRDGQAYGTILLGSQIWMTKNLVYISGGSYSYNDNVANDAIYGRLYEWANVPTAIPTGWHLPTDDEWKILETTLGMPAGDLNINDYNTPRGTDQGTQLKQGGSSGLDFPLAGYRDAGSYFALNNRTYLWMNTDAGGGNIFRRRLVISEPFCYRFTNPAGTFAISVRLVQD